MSGLSAYCGEEDAQEATQVVFPVDDDDSSCIAAKIGEILQ